MSSGGFLDAIRRREVPKHLGGYVIDGELGRGGMGVVYAASHPTLERRVAIKVVLGASEQARQRFGVEARATARLRHRNVVPIHQAGEQDGCPFLVMDLIEGESLKDLLQRGGPLAEREAARITQRLAEGLQAAHDQSILHRDMKPDNVLIDREGEPLITDFGLARDVDSAERLTRTGQVLGTPVYMSPEQAQGARAQVDARSDVYSLGATLYEMLTGGPPFGQEGTNVLVAVVHEAPSPPSSLRRRLDRRLEAICLKCLAKDPAQRYPTARALADDLEHWSQGERITARARGRWWLPVVGGVLAAVGVAAGALLLLDSPDEAPSEEVETADETPSQSDPAPSENGKAEEELAALGGLSDAARVDQLDAWLERYPRHARRAEVVQLRRRTLLKTPWRFLPHPQCRGGVFVGGDRVLSYGLDGRILLWDLKRAEELRRWEHEGGVRVVVLGPDGAGFAYAGRDPAIRWASLKGGDPRILFRLHPGTQATCLELSPRGGLLAVGGRMAEVILLQLPEGKIVERFVGHRSAVRELAFSEEAVVTCSGADLDKERGGKAADNALRIFDVRSGKLLRRIRHLGKPYGASFAPGGSQFVGAVNNGLAIYDVDSGERTAATFRGQGVRQDPLAPVAAHGGWVRGVVWTAEDRIVSVSGQLGDPRQNEIRLWDARTQKELWSALHRPSRVDRPQINGQLLLVSSRDRGLEVWDLSGLD